MTPFLYFNFRVFRSIFKNSRSISRLQSGDRVVKLQKTVCLNSEGDGLVMSQGKGVPTEPVSLAKPRLLHVSVPAGAHGACAPGQPVLPFVTGQRITLLCMSVTDRGCPPYGSGFPDMRSHDNLSY